MRGLIYRELYLSKKSLLIEGGVIVGLILLQLMVILSCKYGNMASMEDAEANNEVYGLLFIMMITIASIGSFTNDQQIIVSDYKAKWNLYSYTLPVSEYKIAAVKIGKIVLGFAAGILLSLTDMIVMFNLAGIKIEKLYVYYIFGIGLFFSVVSCVAIPLTYRFKKEQTAFGVLAVCYAALMFGLLTMMNTYRANFEESHPELDELDMDSALFNALVKDGKALLSHWGWALPLIIIALFAASYFATVRILKRRVV